MTLQDLELVHGGRYGPELDDLPMEYGLEEERPRPPVVIVGERLNQECSRQALRIWRADPLGCMLASPAFPEGSPSRRNLDAVGLGGFRSVNLLPPCPDAKEWDHPWARDNARLLVRDLWGDEDLKLVLCGRRVQEAFQIPVSVPKIGVKRRPLFGTMAHCWGVPCLIFPHPSPRSTIWNEHGDRCIVARYVERFLEA